jgi:hypothetical protein
MGNENICQKYHGQKYHGQKGNNSYAMQYFPKKDTKSSI